MYVLSRYYIQFAVREPNPNAIKSAVLVVVVVGALVAIPLVVALAKRLDKRRVLIGFLALYGSLLTLVAFLPPRVELCYFVGFVVGFGMGAYYVLPDSILGDVIDYDEFHTGKRSESSYTVVETNLQQFMEVRDILGHARSVQSQAPISDQDAGLAGSSILSIE
jgi:melibiose permease